MRRLRPLWSVIALFLVVPLSAYAAGLTYRAAADDPTGPEQIVVDPNDEFVYSASSTQSGHIRMWTRDTGTGLLTSAGNFALGDMIPNATGTPVPLDGIREAKAMAVAAASNDDTHIYVAAQHPIQGGLAAFKRDDASGELRFLHAYKADDRYCYGGVNEAAECSDDSACPGGTCLELPLAGGFGVALNTDPPAGKHLYVAARGSDAVVVFERDAATGLLTPRSAAIVGQGSPTVTYMQSPRNVTVSPDGLNVYVAAQGVQSGTKDGTIVVFDRDTGTGALTFKQSLKYNDPLVTLPVILKMADPQALVVSGDGQHLYVASGTSDAIVIFSRAGGGTLTFLGYQGAGKIKDTRRLIMDAGSPGKYVYATGLDGNSVALFKRDAASGELFLIDGHLDAEAPICIGGTHDGDPCGKLKDCLPGGICDPQPKLGEPQGLALSIDKKTLYVAARGKAISIFDNDYCGNGKTRGDEECDGGVGCVACVLDVCPAVPAPCRTPTAALQASLSIKNDPLKPDSKDQLQWKWKKGAATTGADYGDPTNDMTGGNYVLCVYDNTGFLISRPAPRAGTCAKGKPCWKATFGGNPSALKKYTYQDKLYTPVGISDVQLQVGPAEHAQISVKGKGFFLKPPTLPLSLPITVQLMSTETEVCWGSTFTSITSDPLDPTKVTAKGQ